ncbi:MAG: putative bifunctional diguanylate cyclase/phosphodiesterase, partial [Bosea sp. (in: a-proteobacteria)]
MNTRNITQVVRLSGMVVAMFIAVSTPLTFVLVSYNDLVSSLEGTARLSAGRAARYIFANERMWEFRSVRLQEMIELPSSDHYLYRQSVTTTAGREVFSDMHTVEWPSVVASQPLVVAGRNVGTVFVETSLRNVLIDALWIALLSLMAAGLSFAIVHVWPLRIIARTLNELEDEQNRTSAALSALQASDAQLSARSSELIDAQRLGLIGDWRLGIGSGGFFLSPVAMELLKLDPAAFEPTLAGLKKSVMGEGAERIDRLIADVVRTGQPGNIDVDFRRGDGTVAHLAMACRPVWRDNDGIGEIAGTLQDVTERHEAQRQLEKLAYFDTLTGLANRALFKRELDELIEIARRHKRSSALLLIDLDRFKEVNDSLGHAAGDELLRTVARRLGNMIDNRHFIARLGGDEFAILLSKDGTDAALAEATAKLIVDELSKPIRIGQGEVRVGASIGIVMLPKDGATSDELNKNADLALYRAKENGRGRLAFFEATMSYVIQDKMALARDLRIAATENRDLEVWLQPQIDLRANRVVGFEALLRWQHPTRGFVPPSVFIPIAESSSLITDIGHWVMLESAKMAKRWIDEGHPPYEIAVNLSAAQIWQTNIEEDVAEILKETGLPSHLLCVELTESMLADHAEGRVRRALNGLKALGVKLALDDFGAGYSSLGYLVQLPFDKLKIDRLFIDGASRS